MPSTSQCPSGATRRRLSLPESMVTTALTTVALTGTREGFPTTRSAGTPAGSTPLSSSARFLVEFGNSRSRQFLGVTLLWFDQAEANAYATVSGCARPGLVEGLGG